jgi:predicted GIY-YIG superfamily endonuclease
VCVSTLLDVRVKEAWFVYLLRCGDGTLYCGIALDVAARLEQHRCGKGARYTRGRGPLELVYTEACEDRSSALRRERAIKALDRAEKMALTGICHDR